MSVAATILARDKAFADIPADIVPNYVDPELNGDYYIYGAGITLGVAFLLVVMRFVAVSWNRSTKIGVQEYLQLAALLFAIARYVLYVVDIDTYGMGRHIWDVPLPFNDNLWALATIGNTMYPAGMACAKLSIVLFYLSLFGQTSRKFRLTCYGLIAFDLSYLTAYFLVTIFWCQPLIATWRISALGDIPYRCVNGYEVDLSIGGLNLITDIAILTLPMVVIKNLQLSLWRKLGVAAVFAVGLFAVATVIIREVVIQQKLNNEDADQTWAVIYEATWNSIELHIAIICGASMVLPQFLRLVAQSPLGSRILRSMGTSQGSTVGTSFRTESDKKRNTKGYGRAASATSSSHDTLADLEMQTGHGKASEAQHAYIMRTTTIEQSSEPVAKELL